MAFPKPLTTSTAADIKFAKISIGTISKLIAFPKTKNAAAKGSPIINPKGFPIAFITS